MTLCSWFSMFFLNVPVWILFFVHHTWCSHTSIGALSLFKRRMARWLCEYHGWMISPFVLSFLSICLPDRLWFFAWYCWIPWLDHLNIISSHFFSPHVFFLGDRFWVRGASYGRSCFFGKEWAISRMVFPFLPCVNVWFASLGFHSWIILQEHVYTPRKINIEPENDGLEDVFPFQIGDVQVPCQSSGVYLCCLCLCCLFHISFSLIHALFMVWLPPLFFQVYRPEVWHSPWKVTFPTGK